MISPPDSLPVTGPVPSPTIRWLRPDLVVRVLLSALAAAAVIAFDLHMPAALIAAAALAALYPRRAVLLWIALAGTVMVPLYRQRHALVFFSAAYLCLLLAGAASDLLLQRRAWRAPASLTAALLALALVAVVAGVQGALVYDPSVPGVHRFALVQVYATALIVLSAAAALLVAYRLDDVRPVMVIVIGVGMFCAFTPIVRNPIIPAPGWKTMIVAQAVALTYAMLLRWPPRSFWLRCFAAVFMLYVAISYFGLPLMAANRGQWVSSWMALGVALGVITWMQFPRLRWRVIVPAAVVGMAAAWPFIGRAITRAQMEGDFGRVVIWADALRLLAMRPLLGVGPGNYSDYIERYAIGHPYGSAHGNYQQIAAEMGLLGLGVVLWVIVAALWLAWRQQRSADPFVAAFALGVLGALSGQLAAGIVGDYMLPAYHNAGHTNINVTLYSWILLGALMATASSTSPRSARRSRREEAKVPTH